jgi:hypothetical protein
MNFEQNGRTRKSPRTVLRDNTAHCVEGALLAAAALWLHGEKPLILDLWSRPGDEDHVIALYKRNGYWGAISKTNHASLRFRDPVYRSVRELVLSYFHEWFMNDNGEKMLAQYARPLNLARLGAGWVTSEKDVWEVDRALDALPHYAIVPKENRRYIRRADPIERKAGSLTEWGEG